MPHGHFGKVKPRISTQYSQIVLDDQQKAGPRVKQAQEYRVWSVHFITFYREKITCHLCYYVSGADIYWVKVVANVCQQDFCMAGYCVSRFIAL